MSYIEKLIKKYCPNGVKYKSLGELGDFYPGLNGKSKEDFKNGNKKFITYMNVFSNLAIDFNINDKVKINNNENQNTIKYGDVIFTGSSETINECGMSSVVNKEVNEDIYLNSFCFGFRFYDNSIILPDFSKYIFRSNDIRKEIIKTANGVTRFNISKSKIIKIKIPHPSNRNTKRDSTHIRQLYRKNN